MHLASQTALDADPLDTQAEQGLSTRLIKRAGYLVREGDASEYCLILIEGLALRNKLVARGERQILGLCVPGDIIGLEMLVFDAADHTVQAVTPCSVAAVHRDQIRREARGNADVAAELMARALVETSIAREWQANIGRRTSVMRSAHLICELRYRLMEGEPTDGEEFTLPLSQVDMADALGLTAVHVNRVLRDLEEGGVIVRSKRAFVIPNWQKLRRVADFNPRYLYRDRAKSMDALDLFAIRHTRHKALKEDAPSNTLAFA